MASILKHFYISIFTIGVPIMFSLERKTHCASPDLASTRDHAWRIQANVYSTVTVAMINLHIAVIWIMKEKAV